MSGRLLTVVLLLCVVFAALIGRELATWDKNDPPVAVLPPRSEKPPAPQPPKANIAEQVAATLAAPLFSPTRRPPDQAGSAAASDLAGVRLSGIVIEPERRIAIFAAAGAKPVIRAEGEALNNWRLDRISPDGVSLSGPEGTRTLEPKPDKNLVRPAPPFAAATRPRPAAAVRVRPGAVPGQPPLARIPPPGAPASAPPDQLPRSP